MASVEGKQGVWGRLSFVFVILRQKHKIKPRTTATSPTAFRQRRGEPRYSSESWPLQRCTTSRAREAIGFALRWGSSKDSGEAPSVCKACGFNSLGLDWGPNTVLAPRDAVSWEVRPPHTMPAASALVLSLEPKRCTSHGAAPLFAQIYPD